MLSVDYDALDEIMGDLNIPESERGKINITIGDSPKIGRLGQAWIEPTDGTYNVGLYPTTLQRYGFKSARFHRTVIHELQHIADFIDRDYLGNLDAWASRGNVSSMKKYIGTTAATATAALTLPEIVTSTYNVVTTIPELNNLNGFAILMASPVVWLGGALVLSKQAMYRSSSLERNAHKSANSKQHQLPRAFRLDQA